MSSSKPVSTAQNVPAGLQIDWRQLLIEMLVPVLAIFTALLIGAIIIMLTGASVTAAYSGLFRCV